MLKKMEEKNDIVLYSVNYDKDLFEDYDLDIEVRKIDIPYKNKLMNFPLLIQQKLASKYISKHEIYNSHMFPCHSLNLENNIWIPQEPARILYDLKYLLDNESFSKKALYNIATPALRYIDKSSYKASKTIANINYSRKYLEDVYQIKIDDIVYPGVDVEKFDKDNTKKENNTILLVSRLYKEKNIDMGIRALSYLDDSYSLKIVGTGPYRSELEKLSEELNLYDRVVFYDFVDDQKLTSLYKEAFCVIFMPHKEPFGMVALESMAAGTPVIGLKNGGGYSEIIDDGKNGFLTGFDPQEIAQKIKFLESDEENYKIMVKNCKSSANNYTWDNTAEAAFNVFKNYLDNN